MSDEHKVLGDDIQSYSHSDPDPIRQPLTHSLVTKIAWSPDGTRLASLASNSDQLILWDAARNLAVKKISLGRPLNYLDQPIAFSSDGKTIVSFRFPNMPQHTYSLIDGITGESVREVPVPLVDGTLMDMHLVAAGRENGIAMLFSGIGEQNLVLYDTSTWQPRETVFTLTGLRVPAYEHDMAISPDGQHLALLKTLHIQVPVKDDPAHTQTMSGHEYQLVLWDVAEQHVSSSIKIDNDDRSSWPSIVRFSPDGRHLVVGMANEDLRPVRIFDVASGVEVRSYRSPLGEKGFPVWGWLHGLDWSPDGQLIAFCGEDRSVHVLDANSDTVLDSIKAPGDCAAVAFSPDGTRLAYGADHTVILRKILTKH